MSLWLTAEELIELTGFKTSRRQKLALAELGVEFRSRPADGYPLVNRAMFEAHTVLSTPMRRSKPRLEFVR